MNTKKRIGLTLLFILVSAQLIIETGNAKSLRYPYEQSHFELRPNTSFHVNLKYPSYRKCVLPAKIRGPKKSLDTPSYNSDRNWRLFWSQVGWNAYYLNDADATHKWESEREESVPVNTFLEHGLPVCFVLGWIIVIVSVNVILYPILSMIVIRTVLFLWAIFTHKWIRRAIRNMLVCHQRFQRNQILQVYKDAGRKAPVNRFNMPRFFREKIREAVPKELEETDEEYGSSDEDNELENEGNSEQLKKFKATPEFTPEYPQKDEMPHVVTDEMFAYLLRVNQHGMFAVWTNGLADIDLQEIARINKQNKTGSQSKSLQSTKP